MFASRLLNAITLMSLSCFVETASAQEPVAHSDSSQRADTWASFPTDRETPDWDRVFDARERASQDPASGVGVDSQVPHFSYPALPATPQSASDQGPPLDFKRLMRPRFGFHAEWEPEVGGLAMSNWDVTTQIPTYPLFGPPPPFITAGFSYTNIDAPAALDLPPDLYDISMGMSWMRRINDRWMARMMIKGAFASDFENTSSDAWQIRAGLFALYQPNPRWQFAFGAMATGREDVPVLPALGAIWQPSPTLRYELMLPRPRIAWLVAEAGQRQQWLYLGGGFTGGTWAYRRSSGLDDRLTYREWRLVLGWETTPRQTPGVFRPQGAKLDAEVGFAFGRKFEFDSLVDDVEPDGTLLLRVGGSF